MRVADDDIAFAQRLADAAGLAIRPYFRAPHGLEIKPDESPVTLADRAAEQAMRALIEAERPPDGIVGEDFGVRARWEERRVGEEGGRTCRSRWAPYRTKKKKKL